MATVKNPKTGEDLKIVRDDGYSKIVEDKKGNVTLSIFTAMYNLIIMSYSSSAK